MEKNQVEKTGEKLNFRFPLIGQNVRLSAVKKLIEIGSADTIPYLIEALKSFDNKVVEAADKALHSLKNKDAIDAFCEIWYNTQEKRLDEILTSEKYIAEKPLNIRVATAMKTGKTELCDNAASIELLVALLSDKDMVINQNAEKALRSLKNKDAIDAFCQGIITGTLDAAVTIAIEAGFNPIHIGSRCLFFVITGQFEKYFELDFEFQYLRPEYLTANDAIQQRVRSAIQKSNDHRLMGLFGEVRKKMVAKDLTLHEAQLMLEIYAGNKQYEEIFALLFFAPLPVVVTAIDELTHAKWHPHDDDRLELIANLVKTRETLGDKPKVIPEPDVILGPVFQKWIETGRKEYDSKTEQQLRKYIKSGTPAEAVSALSALVNKKLIQSADHKTFKKHPNWLVRMAYIAIGDIKPDLFFSEKPVSVEGGEYWIENIVPSLLSKTLMQIKPVSLTPDYLNQLSLIIEKAGKSINVLKQWASLLVLLSGYILRNTIEIGQFEQQIEDTAIGIDSTSGTNRKKVNN